MKANWRERNSPQVGLSKGRRPKSERKAVRRELAQMAVEPILELVISCEPCILEVWFSP